MTDRKQCNNCGRNLPLDQFTKHPTTRDGLQVWCRGCKSAQIKEARAKRKQDA